MVGFLFVFILLILSMANTLFNDSTIRTVPLYMDDQANIVDSPPYQPFTHGFIAGSDSGGRDLLHMIIHGAKFTIGIAFLIAILRVLFALIFGAFLGVYCQKYIRWYEKIFDPITVIPLTLVAYYVLFSVIVYGGDGSPFPFWERALFEIAILTFYAVPTLAIYQANEIKKLHKEEFMEAAMVLGGGKLHKLKTHILPHLKENIVIILIQQYIQVLVVLAHLGVLKIFFGGTLQDSDGNANSASHEWSGLIGQAYDNLIGYPWLPLIPILFLGLTILSAQMMLSGFTDVINNKALYLAKVSKPRKRAAKKKIETQN
ncbi:ABC transporter permease subunit [Pradoshia sp. D12]|nr:ABC transporter permease subunit [Pradoshia sp. D12]TPF73789.1 ABC transporter permease subunit [Bacillus sp. D12]